MDNITARIENKKSDKVQALNDIGVDFSVNEVELRGWLNNPFTPYPAIAEALFKILGNKRLRQPVFIDVIVFNGSVNLRV